MNTVWWTVRNIYCIMYPCSKGVALIFHACPAPINQLYRRFWFHEHQHPIKFSDDVTNALTTMGIRYRQLETKTPFDLTDCFEDDFQLPHQKHILDFLTHTKLNRYPPTIRKTCVEYLSSIATGKPQEYSLVRVGAVIDISKDWQTLNSLWLLPILMSWMNN